MSAPLEPLPRRRRTALGKPLACALSLGASLLGGCAATLNQPDAEATTSARIAATPDAAPQRTITNFTASLRCMDDKLARYEIRDLLIGAQEVLDLNNEVAGTKDMLMTSLSTMSRKSKAFGIVTLSHDLDDITNFHKLHGAQGFRAPDFFIRLSTPQIDKGVQVDQASAGVRFDGIVNAEHSRDRIASVVSMDMNLGLVKNLQLLPGIYSSNSIAVVRKGQASDVAGEIRKMGALFRISSDNSEGFHHSVRTLIELGAIELIGRLTQIPYWECLDIDSTNPAVQSQVQDWYAGLDGEARALYVQGKLAALGLYDGPVDGTSSPILHTAIATYKAREGLIADGRIDFPLYYDLVAEPTPVAPAHLALLRGRMGEAALTRAAVGAAVAGTATAGSAPDVGRLTPLAMTMSTERGVPAVYHVGEEIRLSVELSTDAHVYCYYQQGDGGVLKLFPNRFRPYSRISAGETLELPGNDRYQIKTDRVGQDERIMCLASYDDIDAKLPERLRTDDLQPLPVESLEQIHGFYRGVAPTLPLRQTIDIAVVD